jgi:hypothetical protein
MLRIQHCLDSRFTDKDEVVNLTHWSRSVPQKQFFLLLVLISTSDLLTPGLNAAGRIR